METSQTGKPRLKTLWRLSWPAIIEQVLTTMVSYVDTAMVGKLETVTIIHGKGTGALRSAVQQHLKRCKYIKSYRLGTFGEGEAGVTIAEFK